MYICFKSVEIRKAILPVLILILFLAIAPSIANAFTPSGLLEIHYINVGWGTSILVIGPDGTTILMDGGTDNMGTAHIMPYMQSLGLMPADGLDYILASHQHSDHLAGLTQVMNGGYNVRHKVYYNGSTYSTTYVTAFQNAASGTTAGPMVALTPGTVIQLGNGATATCVCANGTVWGHGPVSGAQSDENDRSIGLLIKYNNFDYLFAGDMGGGQADQACTGRSTSQVDVETPLAQAIMPGGEHPLLSSYGVEVLHVNHHGSESSMNANYMNLLTPKYACIATGAGQSASYMFPRHDVVDHVLRAGVSCITVPAAIVLQNEEGQPAGTLTSYAGYCVGDIIIKTSGVANYIVNGSGQVTEGPDERSLLGMPLTVPFDELPELTVISPRDTTLLVCNLNDICLHGFSASAPGGTLDTVFAEGGIFRGDSVCFTPIAGVNAIRLIASTIGGFIDTSITRVTVNLNHAPDAQSPNDTTLLACGLSELRIPGFRSLDADNNITSRVVTPGTLHGDTLYFTPVAGLNTCKIVVTDACGLKDSSITNITVNLNQPPNAQSPNDTSMFMCNLAQIRLPGFLKSDADNNIVSTVVTPGTLHGDTLYFTPVSGLNICKIVVTDACGTKDSSVTQVTVNLNQPPDAQSPADTVYSMCSLNELRIPGFRALDAENSISSITATPGTLHGDTLYFNPVFGLNNCKIVVIDSCGARDSSITRVTVNVNQAPDAQSPNDTTVVLCNLDEIRIPGFRAVDADNNISDIVASPGTLHGDTLYFTPIIGSNTCKILVVDSCGTRDSSITQITAIVNNAPHAISPGDTALFLCTLGQINLPGFRGEDVDGNLVSLHSPNGSLRGDTLSFVPVAGINTLLLIARDACGIADTSITQININPNHAPYAIAPPDTTVSDSNFNPICLYGFGAGDQDGNLDTVYAIGGILNGDNICFTPMPGQNQLKIIAVDLCGEADTAITTAIFPYAPLCSYFPGDINGDNQTRASDITFGVRYFRGTTEPPPDSCFHDSVATANHYLYVAGDVNADCLFRGSDITRLVSYFKGWAVLENCRFFPRVVMKEKRQLLEPKE